MILRAKYTKLFYEQISTELARTEIAFTNGKYMEKLAAINRIKLTFEGLMLGVNGRAAGKGLIWAVASSNQRN